ncbi:MAG TPA: PLP-dependent aminotransferase family protein [Bacillota bacterium]|nr:PLP-dependent aminotransferase family protein [Bacillota bacterium]HQC35666.1 PLP-dependent aminotransferase family protein [Bacillota bacterium]
MTKNIIEISEKLYMRIYEQVRKDIVDGLYPCGSKLPSKRTMAQDRGVSVITVQHAYELLCDEGYVVPRERSGYFVVYDESNSFASEPAAARPVRHYAPGSARSDFPFSVYARTARRTLSVYGEELLVRSPNYGCVILRDAIALYLARCRRIKVDQSQIIIGSGAEYLYGLIVQALGRDRVYGLESPSYEKIAQVYQANGVVCEHLPLGPDGINSEALRASKAGVLHITPYRSYPSGVTASAAKRKEYLRWGSLRDAYIIEDDFESEFTPAKKPEGTLFSLDEEDRVIYLNTFSNSVSASLRIGYMLIPPSLSEKFEENIGFYTCTVPTVEQYVLAELINSGDFERHINRVRRRRRKGGVKWML